MKNGQLYFDTNGNHINAHGGSLLEHNGVWYWYGEHKTEGFEGRLAWYGVHVYSSTDFENWTDCGCALPVVDDPESPICRGQRIERPKVIFCEKTGEFVMYFHSANDDHSRADMGIAVSKSPTGPFELIFCDRAEKGIWPLDVTPRDKDPERIAACPKWEESHAGDWRFRIDRSAIVGRDLERGQGVRDQTLYVDDDGKAWHIYTSEDNSTMHIAELTDDYRAHTGLYTRIVRNRWQEAPVLFKRDGIYYMLTSGCTGWLPNAAHGLYAKNLLGPWFEFENPCRGEDPSTGTGPETTWDCQSACPFFINGQQYVMLDRWIMKNFIDSRYVWLPVEFHDDGTFTLTWQEECSPGLAK